MFFKLFQSKATALALGLAIVTLCNAQPLSAAPTAIRSNDLIAKGAVHQFVTPAQLFAQGTSMLTLTLSKPISFPTVDIRENIKIEDNKSVFKIKQSGFYNINATLTINTQSDLQEFIAVILINNKSYIYFQNTTTSTLGVGSVELTPSASLFLEEGDKISVSLLSAASDSIIADRQLTITSSFNTKN